MSMRAFLYAADALRLEEGVSFHVETEPGVAPQPPAADTRARNAQSMAMLTGMMAGVQKRGRRR